MIKLVALLLPLFLLGGCWDSREISDLSMIIGMGIDREENGMLGVLLQVVVPKNIGLASGEGGKGKGYINYYAESEDIVEGVAAIDRQCDSDIFLPHNQLVLFGRNAAAEGIEPYINFFLSNNNLRITDWIFVAEGDVGEIFDTSINTIEVPTQYLINIGNTMSKTSEGLNINVLDFVKNVQMKSKCSLVPIVKVERESEPSMLKIEGVAIFDGYKMVGTASGKEAQGVFWIKDKVRGGYISAVFDTGSVAVMIESSKTKLSLTFDENNSIKFTADINAEVYQQRDENNITTSVGIVKVKEKIEDTIKSEILASIHQMQELGTDTFGFADEVYRKNPKLWEQIEGNWIEIFKNLDVEINVDVIIRASEKAQ